MMFMRYTQHLKPQEIARQLKCSVGGVYTADHRLKVNYLKATTAGAQLAVPKLDYFYHHRLLQKEDPHLKQLVHSYIEAEGIYNLKCGQIQESLGLSLQSKAPSLGTIAHILKHDFHLRYQRVEGALVHYKNPQFDEKRQWTSRLLAQFVTDGAIVISIDESHIRSDLAK